MLTEFTHICYAVPVSYTHLDVYKRQEHKAHKLTITSIRTQLPQECTRLAARVTTIL